MHLSTPTSPTGVDHCCCAGRQSFEPNQQDLDDLTKVKVENEHSRNYMTCIRVRAHNFICRFFHVFPPSVPFLPSSNLIQSITITNRNMNRLASTSGPPCSPLWACSNEMGLFRRYSESWPGQYYYDVVRK